MYVTALVLIVVCAGYLTVNRRKAAPALVLALALGAGFGLKGHLGLKDSYRKVVEEFRGNSYFGQLQVVAARDRSCR